MFMDNSPFKDRWLRHENGLSVEFDRTFNLKESLLVTIRERKNNFLLIEVFSKLFNTQNYGHKGTILGGRFYLSGSVIIWCFGESGAFKTMREDKL
jgi:hypothetical protein